MDQSLLQILLRPLHSWQFFAPTKSVHPTKTGHPVSLECRLPTTLQSSGAAGVSPDLWALWLLVSPDHFPQRKGAWEALAGRVPGPQGIGSSPFPSTSGLGLRLELLNVPRTLKGLPRELRAQCRGAGAPPCQTSHSHPPLVLAIPFGMWHALLGG